MINKKTILYTLLTSSIILGGCSNGDKNNNSSTNQSNTTEQNQTSTPYVQEAHNFIVKDESGKNITLNDFKGKKVYINIWASWCGPCIREIPEIEKSYQKVKDNTDLVFISIASPNDEELENTNTADESKADILKKANELGATYPVLFDFQNNVMNSYAIRAFPTHIFINSDGTISSQVPGMMTESEILNRINNLK
ncbi:TlpA family protein disulfide reductase [Gemelliphila palaticanis]|uniref:TlpA family protein disulfide reductase n=1 Tax=Gemelliphila palaticanis TaxID=81950 RepID=A0ABX2SY95_9BACL|nr:TlpA disulfide reductase family protein [Gemella palaticanis]MBF0714841.1 TlpA family protein disulfide reductase [Gemella palaticanis]NYS46771.1 TlpA family protein disulfide reductase [Gemella palaticanis]